MQPGDVVVAPALRTSAKLPSLRFKGGRRVNVAVTEVNSQAIMARVFHAAWLMAQATSNQKNKNARIRAAKSKSLLTLAQKHRVVIPGAAFLVLESKQEFARWGISTQDRPPVMTVSRGNIQLTKPDEPLSEKRIEVAVRATRRSQPENDSLFSGATSVENEYVVEAAPTARSGAPTQRSRTRASRSSRRSRPSRQSSSDSSGNACPPGFLCEEPKVRQLQQGQSMSQAPVRGAPTALRPSLREELPLLSEIPEYRRAESIVGVSDAKPGLKGPYAQIEEAMNAGNNQKAMVQALRWLRDSPGEMLAYVAVGRVANKMGQSEVAARAYGSLIDLYGQRADIRRFAGSLLETCQGKKLALDTFQKANADRDDHPSGYRLLAWALAKQGKYYKSLTVLAKGIKQRRTTAAMATSFRNDMGLIAAAAKKRGRLSQAMRRILSANKAKVATTASLTAVLTWESDANDVDLHLKDSQGGHTSYQNKSTSAGELLEDMTQGYGPETILNTKPKPGAYELAVHYYSMGPMGYGLGNVAIVFHDGKGGLKWQERPFVIMVNRGVAPLESFNIGQ